MRDLSLESELVKSTTHGLCVSSQSSGSRGSQSSSSPWLHDQRRLSARSTSVSKPSTSAFNQMECVWSVISKPRIHLPLDSAGSGCRHKLPLSRRQLDRSTNQHEASYASRVSRVLVDRSLRPTQSDVCPILASPSIAYVNSLLRCRGFDPEEPRYRNPER